MRLVPIVFPALDMATIYTTDTGGQAVFLTNSHAWRLISTTLGVARIHMDRYPAAAHNAHNFDQLDWTPVYVSSWFSRRLPSLLMPVLCLPFILYQRVRQEDEIHRIWPAIGKRLVKWIAAARTDGLCDELESLVRAR